MKELRTMVFFAQNNDYIELTFLRILSESYSLSLSIFYPKLIGDILKHMQKTSVSVSGNYMIDYNENDAENEK